MIDAFKLSLLQCNHCATKDNRTLQSLKSNWRVIDKTFSQRRLLSLNIHGIAVPADMGSIKPGKTGFIIRAITMLQCILSCI